MAGFFFCLYLTDYIIMNNEFELSISCPRCDSKYIDRVDAEEDPYDFECYDCEYVWRVNPDQYRCVADYPNLDELTKHRSGWLKCTINGEDIWYDPTMTNPKKIERTLATALRIDLEKEGKDAVEDPVENKYRIGMCKMNPADHPMNNVSNSIIIDRPLDDFMQQLKSDPFTGDLIGLPSEPEHFVDIEPDDDFLTEHEKNISTLDSPRKVVKSRSVFKQRADLEMYANKLAGKYICKGCGRPEMHKFCPAWGTPMYMSGKLFTKEDEKKYAQMRKEALEKASKGPCSLD